MLYNYCNVVLFIVYLSIEGAPSKRGVCVMVIIRMYITNISSALLRMV